MSLDHTKPDQAFRPWVKHQAQYVENQLNQYNATHTRTLTMPEFTARFLDNPPSLDNPPRLDVLFLFTHTLARLMNITTEPAHLLTSGFAGQVQLNLCFDLTLVIDKLIQAKTRRNGSSASTRNTCSSMQVIP